MPKPNLDSTAASAGSRLTYDKGLGYAKYATEQILYIYDNQGKVAGIACDKFNELPERVLSLDQPQASAQYMKELERQFQVLNTSLIWMRYTNTSCLLKAAASFHQLLLLFLAVPQEEKAIAVAETLLDIFGEVEKRTVKPYQFNIVFDEAEMFKPLPQELLTEFPLNKYPMWKQCRQRSRTARTRGKAPSKGQGLIPLLEKEERPVDRKELDTALELAMANAKATKELANVPPSDTPLVSRYRANLAMLTLEDVYKQTNVSIKNRADWKLSELVEVVFYASYITLVLDKNGEPFDGNGIYGLFHYGMILPSKKFKTVKFLPLPGQYVSLGPLAGQQFSFEGGIIKKLPIEYQGVLAYQEVGVTGQWTPDYQQKANEVFDRNRVYIGSLVVESAYHQNDITLSALVSTLPDIIADTLPYTYRAIMKKLDSWFENYQDFLKEIAEEVIKSLVIETLKDLAKSYVIKKLGVKIIPVINAAAALKDAVDAVRGKDFERDNIAVNCVRLYLKGVTEKDDKTLSVKILANIMGDEFEDKIKSIIMKRAMKLGVKLVEKAKHGRSQPPPAAPYPKTASIQQEPAAPPVGATTKPQGERSDHVGADVINKGWQAFQDTRKAHEENRATDTKAANRPEEVMTGGSPTAASKEDRATDNRRGVGKQAADHPVEDKESGKGALKKTSKEERDEGKAKTEKPRSQKEDQNEEDRELVSNKPKAKPKGGKPKGIIPLLPINIHTTASQFRKQLTDYLRANPNHPLSALFDRKKDRLKSSTKSGMDEFYWDEHPEAVQAGHVTSKHSGAPDKIVIMTAHENQTYKSTIEGKGAGASIRGGFKVAVIEGIPITVKSAEHLISYGKLKQKDLDNAFIVDVDDL